MRNGDNKKIAAISKIQFKGKRRIDWHAVEIYLKKYIGTCYVVESNKNRIHIGKDFPDEYANSEYTASLKGTLAKAKANAAQNLPQLIQIAEKTRYTPNYKEKHKLDAKYGWYRYNTRFALPVYNEKGNMERMNIFSAQMLIRYAANGKLYLYDIVNIKKETSTPPQPSLYGIKPISY